MRKRWIGLLIAAGLLTAFVVWRQVTRQPDLAFISWLYPSYQVSPRFLGTAIDSALLTGGHWWPDSDSPPMPLDLQHPELLAWTQLLAPGWLRLGGTEADALWLTEDGETSSAASQLHPQQIQDFLDFSQAVDAKPFITLSIGPLTRSRGQWQPEQMQRLLSWLGPNYPGVLEFGNEPGGHWLFFGRQHQISFQQLAQEYQQAQQLSQAHNIPLLAPANAFWPRVGEPLQQVLGSSRDFLAAGAQPDIFSWHYYPTQSPRCGLRTKGSNWSSLLGKAALNDFSKQSLTIDRWLRQYAPDSPKWLGETGPAQCGGKADLTDRFGASLWWLAHLGEAARTGNQVVIRQSLVGGDYALLSYRQGHYLPNPDFWASTLWQRQMGPVGIGLVHSHPNLRAYAHCHPSQLGQMSLLLINAGPKPIDVYWASLSQGQFFDVHASSLDSHQVWIEQQPIEQLAWPEPELPWQSNQQWRPLMPYSYRWVQLAEPWICGPNEPLP